MPKKAKKKPAPKKKTVKKPLKKKPAPRKKAPVKKPAKSKLTKKKKVLSAKTKKQVPAKLPGLTYIGAVTHYFPHVNAAVIKLAGPLSVGETITVKGHTTDFSQRIDSMQINHVTVETAKKGDEIGVLVSYRVREHDTVYKS